jgi:hypothetical protein
MIQSIFSINGTVKLPEQFVQRASKGGVVTENFKPGTKLAVRAEGGFLIVR